MAATLRTNLCPRDTILAAHLVAYITDELAKYEYGVNDEDLDTLVEEFMTSPAGKAVQRDLMAATSRLAANLNAMREKFEAEMKKKADRPRDPSTQN